MSLEGRFTYHAPKPGQPAKYERIRAAALAFAQLIEELAPDGCNERDYAIDAVDQAVMWANASIARYGQSAAPGPAPKPPLPISDKDWERLDAEDVQHEIQEDDDYSGSDSLG